MIELRQEALKGCSIRWRLLGQHVGKLLNSKLCRDRIQMKTVLDYPKKKHETQTEKQIEQKGPGYT
jgi:hypothetical protein